jgi:hypothetical protein
MQVAPTYHYHQTEAVLCQFAPDLVAQFDRNIHDEKEIHGRHKEKAK